MTEIPSSILSQYLWYNANIQAGKTSIQFSFQNNIMFHNFLITMAPLKNGMGLIENTIYMRIIYLNGTTNRLYSRKMETYH